MGEPFPIIRVIFFDLDPHQFRGEPGLQGYHLFRREPIPRTGVNLRHLLFF